MTAHVSGTLHWKARTTSATPVHTSVQIAAVDAILWCDLLGVMLRKSSKTANFEKQTQGT